jgi:DNA-binding NarL/FixJ family response regulator
MTRLDPAAAGVADGDGNRRVRIVLGEDNFIAREGLIRVLEEIDGVEVAGAFADAVALREAVDRLRPDVVLTDIRMPPTGTDEGIRVAEELRETHPEVGVIVLSQHVEPLYALTLFEQGSHGRAYLLKDRLMDADELRRAVHEVASGGALVDPRVVEELLAHWKDEESPLARLTPRERETLALVAEGRSNLAIALALDVTERAVERHINAIFAKLELTEPSKVNRRVKAALVYLSSRRP